MVRSETRRIVNIYNKSVLSILCYILIIFIDEIKTILVALAKLDVKIDTLGAEVRSIALTMAAKTTDEEIDKTESQILKAFPLITEADLAKVEQRLSTDANYKNAMVSL